ncbi:MAG: putative bifunctional diguanylate cyclase/phosphodiesterase, partial [Nitrospiria bacterium]
KEYTQQAIHQAERHDTRFALLYLNLDRFKRINDTLGHSAGDDLLKLISDALVKHLRGYDFVARGLGGMNEPAPIARFGGDEFTVLITNLDKKESLINIAKRISNILSRPLRIRGNACFMTSSIGIAIYPEDGDHFEMLLKHAGTALDQAKKMGKNGFQFYTKSMNARALKHLSLEGKLQNALEQNELILYYQPQMDIQTEKIIGFEALLRWELPGKGLVPPGDFVPLAEATDLIVPIGNWVLKQACTQSIAWQKAGFDPIQIAVNLSGRQFMQEDLLNNICQMLDESGLGPEWLEIEITETTIMQNIKKTTSILRKMQGVGLKISMDDFGTGYSSMSYLKQFPLNTLKIDQSFVRGITENATDAAIAQAIISLAHSLRLHTIAEGVENIEQFAMLKEQGCQQIQGYLISRPLPAKEVEQFLKPAVPLYS